MTDLKKMRELFQQEERKKRVRQDSGRLGEIIVETWLRETLRVEVEPLPQDLGTKHLLLKNGGKRPDFAIEVDGDVVFIDAKLHSTENLTIFNLNLAEIREFKLAMKELGIDTLFIALIPRESVDRLFLIPLDEIENENEFGPSGSFKLDLSDPLRYFGPITRNDYENAVERFSSEGYDGEVPVYPPES